MKRTLILLIATAIISQAFTQNTSGVSRIKEDQRSAADTTDNMTIVIGDDLVSIKDQDSAVNIRIGSRGLTILESLEGDRRMEFEKYEKPESHAWDQDEDNGNRYRGARSFRGHWAGIEAGFNNYNHVNSMTLPNDISYMKLNTSRSNCFNLNFSQLSIGFSRHIGIVTGVGLNWNNYRFEGMNTIATGNEDYVEEVVPDRPSPLKKSKFSTLYLNVPVMLEVQIPAGYGHRLNLAAGVIGGIKLNAWTKMVFEDDEKFRTNGDYNLNLLRGGATARIGYGNFMIYGTYYLSSWFQEMKGPNGYNLEPFEIGLALTFND